MKHFFLKGYDLEGLVEDHKKSHIEIMQQKLQVFKYPLKIQSILDFKKKEYFIDDVYKIRDYFIKMKSTEDENEDYRMYYQILLTYKLLDQRPKIRMVDFGSSPIKVDFIDAYSIQSSYITDYKRESFMYPQIIGLKYQENERINYLINQYLQEGRVERTKRDKTKLLYMIFSVLFLTKFLWRAYNLM